jgi:hypothetical protein
MFEQVSAKIVAGQTVGSLLGSKNLVERLAQ